MSLNMSFFQPTESGDLNQFSVKFELDSFIFRWKLYKVDIFVKWKPFAPVASFLKRFYCILINMIVKNATLFKYTQEI